MTDFYKILGLEKDASDEEIKKAYRKLSLKFHPDKNQGDKFFENMFKQIQEAYEILSNPNKKDKYDRQFNNKNHNSNYEQKSSKENHFNLINPKIEYFNSNTKSFSNGSEITFKWKVINADIIELVPFGNISLQGQKTYKLKNFKNNFLNVRLKATNTKSGKSIYKDILLFNDEKN